MKKEQHITQLEMNTFLPTRKPHTSLTQSYTLLSTL